MHKTYIKNILRTIRQTISRFGAIFAIVALGVGFLAGLMATTPDMRYSGDIYFDNSKLFDVRVVGTMGLTDDDLAAIKSIDGVGDIMPAYSADMLITAPDGGTIATRIHSLPTGELEKSSPQGYLNRLEVKEGRLPVRENECVIEANSIYSSYGFGVNDTLTISPDNKDVEDTFKNTEYKIVGIVTSSYYFSLEKEDINVGNGILGLVMYVAQENFNLDVYTDFFMTADGVEALNSITDEYDDEVDKTVTAIEDISDARSEIRYKEVKADGNEKLADANKEYEDGRKEADEKLADAQKKIDDGEKEYADGQKKLADARKELADGEADLIKGEVEIRDQEISANAQINDAYTQLNAAQSQIDSGVAAINSNVSAAKGKLTALGQSLGVGFEKSSGFAALLTASQKYPSLSDELISLNTYAARLAEIQALIASGTLTPAEIQALQQEAGEIMPKLAAIQKGAAYTAYSAAIGQLMGELSLPNPADPTLSALTEIAITLSTLDSAKAQLATAQATLTAKRQDVSVMQEQAKEQIAMGYAQLQYGRNDLEEGRAEYKKGERELLDAKKKLEDGKEEYATEKAKAEKKLADARIEIDDAQAKIDDLESPEWYVLTRNENMSAASFKSNTQKVEAIAKIFPVFFFLVAALVALTTMTRMVEEERLQIGTLKALGYSKGTIMAKYLFYALVASVLGSITGLTIGFKLFPTVIWNAYTMMYTLPKLYCPWNLKYALISSGAAIICTLLATLNACWSTLKEKPAALMLPKAPKAGKRILLERITFIWKRMKFTYKVTARNLFRYKKRLLMTVVGIAGCTALLVTGFGLHDSISDIVNKQFGEIFTYDASISLKNVEVLQDEKLQEVLNDKSLVEDYLAVHQEKCTNDFNGKSFSTYIFVPEEFERLPNFLTLRHRLSGDLVPWDENSVVITEKMSTRTGLSVGDTMVLKNKDDKEGSFVITGVGENYIDNYVYMSKSTYENGFSEELVPTTLVLKCMDESQAGNDKLGTAILEVEDVSGMSFVSTLKERFTNMMSKIDIIVVVLIVSAGALAFIVLYNLTNINITERVKEIATIKVLGFTDKEVNSYVYRESIVLALIGTLCGLVFGIFLHLFVILNIEVDMVMFGHTIKPLSYVYSAVLTMVFSVLVNLFMRRKLKNISMVESMKSPE